MEKYGDRKRKLVVDLSPFFLFEAAGDSEGDLDHHHNMMMMGMGSSCHDNEEDDAQSCSYDVWDDASNASSHHHISESRNDVCRSSSETHRIATLVGHDHDDDDDDGKLMMKGSKEGIMYSKIRFSSREDCNNKCTSEVMSTANSNTSRKSCIDSIEGKKMSEKERSRLFWETCLAS